VVNDIFFYIARYRGAGEDCVWLATGSAASSLREAQADDRVRYYGATGSEMLAVRQHNGTCEDEGGRVELDGRGCYMIPFRFCLHMLELVLHMQSSKVRPTCLDCRGITRVKSRN
jgi:hypothetical protein